MEGRTYVYGRALVAPCVREGKKEGRKEGGEGMEGRGMLEGIVVELW
jgi:hypothetical protein